MVLGPWDRRALKTRCQACAKRRIKCAGPPPCLHCNKKKIKCVPQAINAATEIVFVNTRSIFVADEVSRAVSSTTVDVALAQFFAVFIARNDFAGAYLDTNSLIGFSQSSPSLHHAALAIGSLDLRNTSASPAERRATTARALQSYQASIVAFKSDMQHPDLRQNDAALWTTFFLGLFELMYDVTGEGWVKHILYGTSSILQFRGPEAHLSGHGRTFFSAIRIFEICRSLIYSKPSFLSQPEWLCVSAVLFDQADSHPKEKLFDIMLSCSSLSCRVWEAVKPDLMSFDESALIRLADEGHHLRALLNEWHESARKGSQPGAQDDPWLFLGMIYYHATSIYLSGIFDYRPQFDHLSPASLPLGAIQTHVKSLLMSIEVALTTTKLAGVLFFFPLRVAGARAWSEEQKLSILKMLKEISKRAYVVAGAFLLDLTNLWGQDRSREDARRAWD